MSTGTAADFCRLTVVCRTRRVDLAVPASLAVADLRATVVASLGRAVADAGNAAGGWVLQRVGGAPLDPERTVAASELRDGDVLHLRTASSALPSLVVDDVPEAVAGSIAARTNRWRPKDGAHATTAVAAAMLACVLATTSLTGPPWRLPATIDGLAAAAAMVVAVLFRTRRAARVGPAVVAGAFAIAFAAAGAAAAAGGAHPVRRIGALQVLVGSGAGAVVGIGLLVASVGATAFFAGCTAMSLLVAAGAGIAVATSGADTATAIVAAVGVGVAPLLPSAALWLAGLRAPSIAGAHDRAGTADVAGDEVHARAARADDYLTGLVCGTSLPIAGAAGLLADQGVVADVLVGVLGLVCLLRVGLFAGRGQRVGLLVAGVLALLAVVTALASHADATVRLLAVVVPTAVLAFLALTGGPALVRRRYPPTTSRAVDVLESALTVAVFPVAASVAGLYAAVRQVAT